MNKTKIKNFSVWARNKLIDEIRYRAGLMGITEDGIQTALPQSAGDTEFYDIGTAQPYAISGEAVGQRRKLVEAIREKERSSGYQTAYRYIVEEVAYTWFNRLIAIRFMEVNDYLPAHIRVLSSESGRLEPDLVASPFEADLPFTEEEKQTVLRLQQDNRIDELFRLLFIKQCNALNEILPGLFEKINDYTELLLNLSVIDRDGVVYRLTHEIDEDDFNIEKETDDGEGSGQVEIIGWLYQYWNTEPNEQVYDGNMSKSRIPKELLPAATTIYTPDWPIHYMVENSLGRLWLEGHPNEKLKSGWKYYLEEANQEPVVQAQLAGIRKELATLKPEEIRCIDPCMGSGHILCRLFDVLMQIYESQGYSPRDAAQSIVQNNLYGLDIDKRATQLAYFSVMMKARHYDRRFFSRGLQPMVYSTTGDEEGENFGSLVLVDDPGERPEEPETMFDLVDHEKRLNVWNYRRLLAQKYHVVCTNPPYLGNSRFSPVLDKYVKKNYADEKADLCMAMFKKSLQQLCKPNGYVAFITTSSWMFLSSFEKTRKYIYSNAYISTLVDFGTELFDGKVGHNPIVSWITRKAKASHRMTAIRLVNYCYSRRDEKRREFFNPHNRYIAQQDNFSKIPGSPVAYWVSTQLSNAFLNGTSINQIGSSKSGMQTGNNDLFLRLWYEVSYGKVNFGIKSLSQCEQMVEKWIPQPKGGSYRKWYGNLEYVVNFAENGKALKAYPGTSIIKNPQYYFTEGISWSHTTSKSFSARYMPQGCIFNVEAPSFYPYDLKILYYILGVFNTKVLDELFGAISQTMHYMAGDMAKIPIYFSANETLQSSIQLLVQQAISISRADWDSYETSWDFIIHPLVRYKSFSPEEVAEDAKHHITDMNYIEEAFTNWRNECYLRFTQLKSNEEELNRIFIDIYGLGDELTPDVADRDVTVHRVFCTKEEVPESMKSSAYVRTLRDEIVSLLSYAVGCMFGRYSLDVEGLAYAGGAWDASKYSTFLPDTDVILPITDEEYLEDDLVGLLCAWLKKVYGTDTLEENLDFIAGALGNKGTTSREIIRNYFLKDFYADHCKTYQKRPIYWLFDSGKQNGFKALIYLHRYTPDTIGRLRVEYLHRMQRIYESETDRMQDMIDNSQNPREVAACTKRKEKLQKQLKECREYDEKISHLALSRIVLDLDDGVKVNYRKAQTATDGKFYEVLADSKSIIGKK